ncbi:uncharacterized protein F5Z01DRAFT_479520 [Emericellopsis atlantica]|uniref:Rhodopsin domain-containing protein n=1 Tax=Emericellopsis atlantica TaxID=2614577 RepID=A0A9P7ZQZ6_9HYPO|nr:uncharacterized protein F5Z01DRAFT_479520 [Emericellopsis atlantica]KAG9256600.1 hypothetical protein F5Z01DRAFT_479520 [Emericellopsis atlantica]
MIKCCYSHSRAAPVVRMSLGGILIHSGSFQRYLPLDRPSLGFDCQIHDRIANMAAYTTSNRRDASADPGMIYPLPTGDPAVTTTVLVSIWVMASTSTVFLALRLYCRISRAKSWWDDYLLIAGWVFLVNALILQTCIFHDGYLVTALGGPVMGPMNLGSDSSMKLSLALIKTSFALTLCGFATGWLHWVVVVVTVVTDAAYMSHAILVWRANCGVEDSYTFEPCWPMDSGIWMNMIGSIISAVGDLVLSLVPAAVVWKLQMIRREKIGVAAAMAIGILAGAVAIMKAVEAPKVVTTVGTDFSYKLARLSILVHAEPNAALIAACIPVLRILLRDVRKTYFSSSSRTAGRYLQSNEHSGFQSNRDVKGTELRTLAAEADNDSETSILPLQDIAPEQQRAVCQG